jgi:hypothetical protein
MTDFTRLARGNAGRGFLLSGAVLLSLCAPAQAQNFFEALFGGLGFRTARPAPTPFFAPQPQVFFPQRRSIRRERPAVAAAPVEKPKTAKPARAASMAELLRDILDDDTLRRGDVVVFADGPRVFVGGGSAPHDLSDFQDIRESRLVGKTTRTQLLASAGTPEERLDRSRSRKRPLAAARPPIGDEIQTTASTLRVNAMR